MVVRRDEGSEGGESMGESTWLMCCEYQWMGEAGFADNAFGFLLHVETDSLTANLVGGKFEMHALL